MKVKSESEVVQSCPTLSNPMDCSLPGSSIHGIFQARVLEWGAIAFSGTWIWELFYPNLSKVVDSTASCCSCSVSQTCPTLQPHGLQHVRPSCPSPSPRVCPSSYLLNRWHYPTVSSFAALFSFCLQSFPATECFPITWLFVSGGPIIEALASVLPMSVQG